jgi:hypothetical protein
VAAHQSGGHQRNLADTAPPIQHAHPSRNPRAPQKLFGERIQDGSLQGETASFAVVVPHDVLRVWRQFESANAFPWRMERSPGSGSGWLRISPVLTMFFSLDRFASRSSSHSRRHSHAGRNSIAVPARPYLGWRDN